MPTEKSFTIVYGGSFNPPHVAHVLSLCLVRSTVPCARILVIPTFRHPFGKPLTPYEQRITMCELAMGWIDKVTVSRVEEELGGDSLTLRTLTHLSQKHPEYKLRLLIGSDIMSEAHKWHAFDQIEKLAPPIVLDRSGFEAKNSPILPKVSSTEIRTAFANNDHATLVRLVPHDVLQFAEKNALYTQ